MAKFSDKIEKFTNTQGVLFISIILYLLQTWVLLPPNTAYSFDKVTDSKSRVNDWVNCLERGPTAMWTHQQYPPYQLQHTFCLMRVGKIDTLSQPFASHLHRRAFIQRGITFQAISASTVPKVVLRVVYLWTWILKGNERNWSPLQFSFCGLGHIRMLHNELVWKLRPPRNHWSVWRSQCLISNYTSCPQY